ncbi:MAG TPA: hypothetical protein VGF53_00185 [Pseudolabrys sp.]|jgi:hypothetical protein
MRVPPPIANALLVIASALICYVAMEYAIFRVALPIMPLDIWPQLPSIADVLTQNSKAAYLPHDYVALLGDSNAEGLGDWLLETKGDRTKPFHSANVIHNMTGRNVVTFGKGGAGSAEGIVLRPAQVFPSSPCSVFPAIDPPRQMFVYFYEGNDVEDNLSFLGKVKDRYGRADAEAIDRFLAEKYAGGSPWDCHLELADTTIRMAQFLFQYYVAGAAVVYCGAATPHANRIVVDDGTIEVPTLQGAALGISEENIRRSMNTLAHSLSWLRKRFSGVPISVIYVPSPLAVYRHAGDSVSHCITIPNANVFAPTAELEWHHDLMRNLVAKISADQGMDFADATPALRAAASTHVIHGPRDWDHLNESGYRVLGALVSSRVQTVAPAK